MAARWSATALLAVAALTAGAIDAVTDAGPLIGVAAALGAFNAAVALAASRSPRRWPMLARLALLADVTALTAFLGFSGDIENPMRSTYALPVVAAALVATRRFATMLAAVSLVLFCGLVAAVHGAYEIRIDHRHVTTLSIEHQAELEPAYLFSQLSYLAVLLAGSSLGFGTLAERLRRSEQEVVQDNERLQFLLNTLPDGVVLLRRDGSAILASSKARRDMDALAAIVDLPAMIRSLAGAGTEFETRQGDRVIVSALVQASPDDPVVWVFRDLTQQRRLMAQVIHGSKMADLGLLAAGIAHEIGNPLSSMSAVVQLMRMEPADATTTRRLGALSTNIDRIRGIVRDVTHYASPPADARRRVTLDAVVGEAVSVFRLHDRGKDVRVSVETRGRPPPVDATEGQIVQVLLNLLLNAADASGGSGGIGVVVAAADGEALVSVKDDGPGMDEAVIPHLFVPFFTTKSPGAGTGLGLFICESIVVAHGGRIEVDAGPGRGSTFTVHLPAAA